MRVKYDELRRQKDEHLLYLQSTALESAGNGVIITDRDGTILWANPAFGRNTGYEPVEVIGKNPSFLQSGKHDEKFYHEMWATIRRGDIWQGEVVNRRKDGSLYTEEMTITPVRDQRGEIAHFVAIKQDITPRKLAQQKQEESEQRFAAFMSNTPAMAWAKDDQGRYVYVNRAYLEHFGEGESHWLGKTDAQLWPEEQARVFTENDRSVFQTGRSLETYEQAHDQAGTLLVLWTFKFPFQDAAGRRYVGGMGMDVTESKLLERQLREARDNAERNQAQYQAVINSMTEGLVLVEASGDFVEMNPAALSIHGFASREELQQNIHKMPAMFEVCDMDDNVLPLEQWPAARALNGETFSGVIVKVRRLDGTRQWIGSYGGAPVRNAHGEIVLGVATLRDITEFRQAQEALRDKVEVLSLAQRAARMGVFDCDIVGNRAYWTAEMQELMGTTLPEVSGNLEHWMTLVHPQDRSRVQRMFINWLNSRQEDTGVIEYRLQNGDKERWMELRGRAIRDSHGNPVRLVGTNIEITQRKEAEAELRKTATLLQTLSATTPDPLFVKDRQGRMVWANPATLRAIGKSAEGVLGKNELSWHHNREEALVIMANDRRVMETGETDVVEESITGPSGTRVFLSSKSPMRDGSGQIVGVIGLSRDITDRKRIEDELASAKHSAEAANAAKDHFLAVLSHELRTPLSAVIPSLDELGTRVSGESAELLAIARRNVELEARLIDDLLDVTRIARGKIELERRPDDLCRVIEHAAEVVGPDIDARGIKLALHLEDCPYPVNADHARLQQVFWNLLKNAVKFTPHGGSVDIHGRRMEGQCRIDVTDSGQGIEAEALSRVFNAFEQESRSTTRQFGGLGLGLAISRALVEMHGGTIRAFSKGRGQGATFTVDLPLLQAVEATITAPHPEVAAAETPTHPRRHLHILLVEDHGDTARVLIRLLRHEGHEVEHAGDVATALQLAESANGHPFDVLLSDLGLPDGSGHDLMRELQARGYRIPAVAISGYGMAADVEKSHQAGFVEHVIKPVRLQNLEEALDRAISVSPPT